MTMAVSWLDLPTDILQTIFQKLGSPDFIRLKTVSSSWRKAVISYTSSQLYSRLRQTPWLMLPIDTQLQKHHAYDSLSLYSFEEKKFYEFKNFFTGAYNECSTYVVGSSFGWLIFFQQKYYKVTLFHPFSRTEIQLPSLPETFGSNNCCFISKVILLSDPSIGNNSSCFRVVVSSAFSNRLAIFIDGDGDGDDHHGTWTKFGDQLLRKSYKDIVYHNDKLYALVGGGGLVEVWDLENNKTFIPTKLFSLDTDHIIPKKLFNFEVEYTIPKEFYLVESLDDGVLLVVQAFNVYVPPDVTLPLETTVHFYVFKLDYCGKNWKKVDHLGDQIVFLNRKRTGMLVPAQNSLRYRKNSIYYTGLDHCSMPAAGTLELEVGEYNLEEKIAKPFHHVSMHCSSPCSLWIVPNLVPPATNLGSHIKITIMELKVVYEEYI